MDTVTTEVLVRPGRELLSGKVEVDETYIGGAEPGLSGGQAQGKKVLTAIAVEILEPKGWGRCRMAPIADASASSRSPFREGKHRARLHRHHGRLEWLHGD